jgi:ketosteroid isomerase-like protein
MKLDQRLLIALAIPALLCCSFSTAWADDEADRAALRMLRTNYMEAVNSGDLSRIAPHVSKDLTAVMVTGEEVKGFDGLAAYWKKTQDLIGPGGSYHQTVNADQTDLYNDVAVSRGNTEDIVRLGNGKELRFASYWTAICRKEENAWKVIRMEATMNPVDNVFISLQLQRTKLVCGIGGIAAGAILILIINFFRCRAGQAPAKTS